MPSKNFICSFSLKRKKNISDVKIQYIEKREVIRPWLIPALLAYMKAIMVVDWKTMFTNVLSKSPITFVTFTFTFCYC